MEPVSPIERFVFIVTYGRSGSTLLQRAIGGLPGFHISGENNGAAFKLIESYDCMVEARRKFGGIKNDIRHPWFGIPKVDLDSLGKNVAQIIVEQIIIPPNGTRVAGFKEIRWLDDGVDLDSISRFICNNLSSVQFVVNIRDPESVARSGWWRDRPREEVVERISSWNDRLKKFVLVNHHRSHLMEYEKYSSNPVSFLPLFNFLKEPFDENYVRAVLHDRLDHKGIPS